MNTPDTLRIVAVHRTVDENGLPTDQLLHGTGTLPTDVKLVEYEQALKLIRAQTRRWERAQDTLDAEKLASAQRQHLMEATRDEAIRQAVMAERKRCADVVLLSSSGDVAAMARAAEKIQQGPKV
jgi:hypothetical protein